MVSRRTFIQMLAATGALAGSGFHGLSGARAARATFWSDRVSVRTEGAGRDIVFIPGLGSAPPVFGRLAADVPNVRATFIHVRGFAGLAPRGNRQGPLIDGIADEIARYVSAAGLRRPLIVGHSMGGTIALRLAANAKVRATGALIIDMLPEGAGMVGGTASGTGYLASQLRGYFTQTKAGRRAFAQILAESTPGGATSDPDVIALALEELANTDLSPLLPDIAVPLRVLAAAPADGAVIARQRARYEAAYAAAPKARVAVVSPSSHVVMADQPTVVARALRALLAETA